MARWKDDLPTLREVKLDISTLTLGEAAAAEIASGYTIQQLAKGRATLRLLAMFVHILRHYGVTPNWSDLSSLRLLDGSSSTTPDTAGERSETSQA